MTALPVPLDTTAMASVWPTPLVCAIQGTTASAVRIPLLLLASQLVVCARREVTAHQDRRFQPLALRVRSITTLVALPRMTAPAAPQDRIAQAPTFRTPLDFAQLATTAQVVLRCRLNLLPLQAISVLLVLPHHLNAPSVRLIPVQLKEHAQRVLQGTTAQLLEWLTTFLVQLVVTALLHLCFLELAQRERTTPRPVSKTSVILSRALPDNTAKKQT